jgi:hypothetical protein
MFTKLSEHFEFRHFRGTTNMLNHIRLKHSIQDESAPVTPDKQSSVISFLCSPRARHLSGKQTDEITNAIVNMIVLDYLPLSLVEGKGFLKLMSVGIPGFVNVVFSNCYVTFIGM